MAFGVKSEVEVNAVIPATTSNKAYKPELGAIWRKQGKTKPFYSMKLKFTVEQLTKILNSPKDEKGLISVNYVAFNNSRKDKENQPDILIYEDQKP